MLWTRTEGGGTGSILDGRGIFGKLIGLLPTPRGEKFEELLIFSDNPGL